MKVIDERTATSREPARQAWPAHRRVTVLREGFSERPGLDTALSRALLLRTSEGALAETFRMHTPADVVAFGRQDVIAPGYGDAIAAAHRHGFGSVRRITGGRAAVFHGETLALAWTLRDPEPAARIHERFSEMAGLLVGALARLGIQAGIGETPGEYCPGRYSLHVGGRKVAGLGQRMSRDAAHVGGVLVVGGADRVQAVLTDVYASLGLDWAPHTTGDLRQVADVTTEGVTAAIEAELAARVATDVGAIDGATLALAESLLPEHVEPS